jgi:uncharacterized membrane protein
MDLYGAMSFFFYFIWETWRHICHVIFLSFSLSLLLITNKSKIKGKKDHDRMKRRERRHVKE